jgi:hypothetical protein
VQTIVRDKARKPTFAEGANEVDILKRSHEFDRCRIALLGAELSQLSDAGHCGHQDNDGRKDCAQHRRGFPAHRAKVRRAFHETVRRLACFSNE